MCVLLTSKEKSTPPIRSQFTLKCKVRLHDTVIPTTKLRSASGCQGPGLVYKNRARRNLENLSVRFTGNHAPITTLCSNFDGTLPVRLDNFQSLLLYNSLRYLMGVIRAITFSGIFRLFEYMCGSRIQDTSPLTPSIDRISKIRARQSVVVLTKDVL